MWSKRGVVDYALQRRRALRSLESGARPIARSELCDADPSLLRSARDGGERVLAACPVCRVSRLTLLRFAFGAELGQRSGCLASRAELNAMQDEFGEFLVRVVEVCQKCGWNHIIESFLLGDGVPRKPRRKQTVEDIYG